MVTEQDHLGACFFRFSEHAGHLSRADHSRFIDHQNILAGELVFSFGPGIFKAGQRAGIDAGPCLELICGFAC
jgi:hypothetical protein